MAKPQKHAEFIHAWADGAEIEFYLNLSAGWVDKPSHVWFDEVEYRIKERKFPKSSLTSEECSLICRGSGMQSTLSLKLVADEAVKRYILEQENEE